MNFYDEKLQRLGSQVARKRQLTKMLSELEKQRAVMEQSMKELEKSKDIEQADVDRLEHRTLTALFYTIAGKKEDQINKERAEAYAARIKYEAATEELSRIIENQNRYEVEREQIQDCEQWYQATLDAKAEAIRNSHNQSAQELFQEEGHLSKIRDEEREIQEAVEAGERALHTTKEILDKLDSAHGWGTYDLIGGGLIADVVKHGHLDEAQSQVERLQGELGQFRTELADVSIHADMRVSIDGFLRFADYFFDGIFADWTVLDKIDRSISKVKDTKNQIEKVLGELSYLRKNAEEEEKKTKEKLEKIVRTAEADR